MNKLKNILIIVMVLAGIAFGGYYAIHHVAKTSTDKQTDYAASYEAHALSAPFNLLSRDWSGSYWTYHYQAVGTATDALTAAKSQLSGGGYQVIQASPDTADTIYRDLITGDIAVTAKITQSAPGQVTAIVRVEGIKQ